MVSMWERRIEESQVRERLAACSDAVAEISAIRWKPEAEVPEYMDGLHHMITSVRDRLEISDPRRVPQELVNTLVAEATSLHQRPRSFIDDDKWTLSHVHAATTHAEKMLVIASGLPPAPWGESREVVANAARRFRDTVAAHRRQHEKIEMQRRKRREALVNEIAETTEDFDTALSDHTSESTESLADLRGKVAKTVAGVETRTAQLQKQSAEQVRRTDALIEEKNRTFAAAEEDRAERSRSRQGEYTTEFEAALSEQSGQFAEAYEGLMVRGGELISYLQETRDQAEVILGVQAAAGTAAAYGKEATRQRRETQLWRLLAMASLAGAFIAAVVAIGDLELQSGSSFGDFFAFYAPRIWLGALAFAVGTFAIKQSNHHREREYEARKLANELTILRPFLAGLPEAIVHEQVVKAVPRYFRGAHAVRDGIVPPDGEEQGDE